MVLGNSEAYSSRQQKAFERKTKWQELEAVGDIRSRGGNEHMHSCVQLSFSTCMLSGI